MITLVYRDSIIQEKRRGCRKNIRIYFELGRWARPAQEEVRSISAVKTLVKNEEIIHITCANLLGISGRYSLLSGKNT